jgi:hypothetical protein
MDTNRSGIGQQRLSVSIGPLLFEHGINHPSGPDDPALQGAFSPEYFFAVTGLRYYYLKSSF